MLILRDTHNSHISDFIDVKTSKKKNPVCVVAQWAQGWVMQFHEICPSTLCFFFTISNVQETQQY